ncbi:MAG: hypothetical protein CM15mP77_4570 [Synechococcus sp.]|nr:MAG: hypothetical protein CM15mP77_4570 [Synechococcus sp.]
MVVADPIRSRHPVDDLRRSLKGPGGLVESYNPLGSAGIQGIINGLPASAGHDWSWAGRWWWPINPTDLWPPSFGQEQRDGAFGGGAPRTPNWVPVRFGRFRICRRCLAATRPEHPARGDNWLAFEQGFSRVAGEARPARGGGLTTRCWLVEGRRCRFD